jgi:hypothetical protein
MTYGLSTRTISAPLGTAGVFSPTAPAVKLVPLSVFFLNREGEGAEGAEDGAMYGLQTPSDKAKEGLKKAKRKEPVGEPGEGEEEPEKGPQGAAKRKKRKALKKKGPPQKPKEPEQGGPEPKGGAIESICEKHYGLEEGKISEPQACKYCGEPATQAYIWAEGRAYIPVCEKHRKAAKTRIEKTNRDKVTAVRPIPQRQTTAAAEQAPITPPVLTPIKDGALRTGGSGAMGTGNIARYHVPLGPPLRRMSPVGGEEERPRKRKRKRLQGEDRDRWIERLLSLAK